MMILKQTDKTVARMSDQEKSLTTLPNEIAPEDVRRLLQRKTVRLAIELGMAKLNLKQE